MGKRIKCHVILNQPICVFCCILVIVRVHFCVKIFFRLPQSKHFAISFNVKIKGIRTGKKEVRALSVWNIKKYVNFCKVFLNAWALYNSLSLNFRPFFIFPDTFNNDSLEYEQHKWRQVRLINPSSSQPWSQLQTWFQYPFRCSKKGVFPLHRFFFFQKPLLLFNMKMVVALHWANFVFTFFIDIKKIL